MSKTANTAKLPFNQCFICCDEYGCCFIYNVCSSHPPEGDSYNMWHCYMFRSRRRRRNEADTGSYFLRRPGHQLVTHISLSMQNQQPYANGNIRYISSVFLRSFSASSSPPSVCSQCQPLISPCKVSVVRSPCLDTAVESNAAERQGGGANSLRFVCQVCCCYATHFGVEAKSREMQNAGTLFTSEIGAFASARRQPRAARDYIIAGLCFGFNANYTSLNGVSTSAFKALIIFC